ncbi:phage baseplate assembly protein V [Methylophaga thiooxydans]|uniref:phage baseplate assembly protein V n=1 Tax=Methylophaga thiooxydans TaxID=392484 RepID=UPI002352EB12|nr:phage baseplate assembly protein V [Methylophaga thiooxydans]
MRRLQKLLSPLKRGLQQMLRAGTLLKVNDSPPIQMVQIETLSGEVIEVPRIQDYGITSVPLPGAKGVVAAIGGKTNGYVCIKMDDKRYRQVNLKPGEVALYDNQGQLVHLKQGGLMELIANTQITAKVPVFRIEGQLNVTGDIIDHVDSDGLTMASMRSTYNGHNHDGDSGGTTSNPNQSMTP